MRGKVAKQLRNGARKLTVGKPAVAYEWATEMVTRRGKRVQVGHIVLKDDCTRKVYQKFKKMKREMQRGV